MRKTVRKERKIMRNQERYRGRIAQIFIYLGKLFRMFIYQNDWKMIPMAALIAGMTIFAVGTNMFKTQEGTLGGCFALVCVCVWNGFFNSIQSVVRERPIVKREHRAGMHISSYIIAHMIYQAILCLLQTLILLGICEIANVQFPAKGLLTDYFKFDFGLAMFLISYTADILSLLISCTVKSTTTAMTVMPFMLMFQLVFSGGMIYLEGAAASLTNLTIAKWGQNALCALGGYNDQPNVTLWNTIWNFRALDIKGFQPVKLFTDEILKQKKLNEFLAEAGKYTRNEQFASTSENVLICLRYLLLMTVIFAVLSILILKRVDRDKR